MDEQQEHNPETPADGPHDILAAEAFAVGAGDPGLHQEPAHDVLAADEFPVPAPQPHAVPPEWQSPGYTPGGPETALVQRPSRVRRLVPAVLLAGVALFVLKRRRGSRTS
jgi:hypothetical protein